MTFLCSPLQTNQSADRNTLPHSEWASSWPLQALHSQTERPCGNWECTFTSTVTENENNLIHERKSEITGECQLLTAARSRMVLSLPSLSSSSSSSLNSAAALSMNLKASSMVAESDTSGLLWEKRVLVTTRFAVWRFYFTSWPRT